MSDADTDDDFRPPRRKRRSSAVLGAISDDDSADGVAEARFNALNKNTKRTKNLTQKSTLIEYLSDDDESSVATAVPPPTTRSSTRKPAAKEPHATRSSNKKAKKNFSAALPDDIYTPDGGEEDEEEEDVTTSVAAPPRLGFCPFCQVPFAALSRVESESWHVSSCLSSPSKATRECEAGRLCDSTIPSHFKKFSHCMLAEWRDAGVVTNEETSSGSSNAHIPTFGAAGNEITSDRLTSSVPHSRVSELKGKGNPKESKARKSLKMGARKSLPNDESRLDRFFVSGGTFPTKSASEQQKPESPVATKRLDDEMEEFECSMGISMEAMTGEQLREGGADLEEAGADFENGTPSEDVLSNCVIGKESQVTSLLVKSEDAADGGSRGEKDGTSQQEEEEELSNSQTQAMWAFIDDQLAEDGYEEAETFSRKFKTEAELDGLGISDGESVTNENTNGKGSNKCNDTFALLMRNAKNKGSVKDVKNKGKGKKSASTALDNTLKENNGNSDSTTTSAHVISKEASEWLKTKTVVFPKTKSNNAPQRNEKDTFSNPKSTSSDTKNTSTEETPSVPDDDKNATKKKPRNKNNTPRPCPFYKWIPNTSFTVDAFSFGQIENCRYYFLSHFHADHYKGLNKSFQRGQIVCSKVTANLVMSKLGVSARAILSACVDETLQLEGAKVTLIEANHCPGAVLFLFRLSNGSAYLHTGDFRADEQMLEHPSLQQFVANDCRKRLDGLFLDTTYLDPRYSFPPQRDVIEFAAELAADFVQRRPRTLIICGSYTIGKERIFKAIASALGIRVFVRDEKSQILKCLEDDELMKMLSRNPLDARLHVLPMHLLNKRSLLDYLRPLKSRFDNVLALKPTGWTFQEQKSSTLQPRSSTPSAVLSRIEPQFSSDGITLYGIPYSEHSSFEELKRFVSATRPTKVIPTVNVGNADKRNSMQAYFDQWLKESRF